LRRCADRRLGQQPAKAGYAIGFGGLAAAEWPAFLLTALALLGFAAAAAYLM
jgi:hypothetical protein